MIGKNDAGQRLDKFLQKRFKTMPKSMLYMYIRKKCIKINGKKCDIADKLREGDELTFFIKDEFFDAPQEKHYDFLKAPSKLDIVYEDGNLLLLNKKPGVIVHQDKSYHFDSLVARVQHYLYEKGEYDPEADKAFAPALVNRIDRNTGGIVIAAKNAESLRILNQKMKTREMEKFYLCLLCGRPKINEANAGGGGAAHRQDPPDPRPSGIHGNAARRRHQIRRSKGSRRPPLSGALQLQAALCLFYRRRRPAIPRRQGI